ncbi:MAG TPA: hypothetical protein VFN91_13925, partial [Myxococcaceae bacterium]|nr:hypothetical protein [Myxococcaceae bacterium]
MKTQLTAAALLALAVSACKDEPPGPLSFINDPLRADAGCDWGQWGQNWAHTGQSCVAAQGFGTALATITFDPFVEQELQEAVGLYGEPALLVHYASPLIVGDDLYMAVKAGQYTSCNPPGQLGSPPNCGLDSWPTVVWTVEHHAWTSAGLQFVQRYESSWKPPPWQAVNGWEPVFQPAVSGQTVFVPAAGGTVVKLDRQLANLEVINPFGAVAANRYVTGPLVVDADGTLLYNVIELDPLLPVSGDAQGYLVKASPGAAPVKVLYQAIVSGAPAPSDLCTFSFSSVHIAGPYPATVPAPTGPCGSQRPGFNSAPAIGPGGTVFVVSRAHHSLPPQAGESLFGRSANDSSIVAVNPDLTPKWTFRMREILEDGCGVLASCRQGAPRGVDPSTGLKASVWVWDQASSVPVALPDGAVLYGGLTSYNGSRGHLMKVGPDGKLMGTYDFGWDVTPAVWVHNGTYSIITKDNHYPTGTSDGPYYITQLSRDLSPEWQFKSTETRSCSTETDGGLTCTTGAHPD